jgi:hypothetical protein
MNSINGNNQVGKNGRGDEAGEVVGDKKGEKVSIGSV